MGKEKINLGLFTSVYSYFLFLLLKGYNKKDIVIVHNSFPKEISKNINPIIVSVATFKSGSIKQSISQLGIKQMIKGFATYFSNYLKLRIILFFKTFNKNVENYGHAFSPYSFMFFENENSNIIEDGLANYTLNICEPHKINTIIDKFLHIFGFYYLNTCETYGTHQSIKTIYLTRENNNPLIKDKVKIMNIEELWKNLSEKKQKEILTIFNIDLDKLVFKGKTALILTQPLYEDNIESLETELQIYGDIIDKFKDYEILIKPHPRDEKNYEEIYPNVKVIDRHFPIELLSLIGIEPTVACSLVSTALFCFKNSKIYVYDGELENEYLNSARKTMIEMIKKERIYRI